jgi:hypothetical protein
VLSTNFVIICDRDIHFNSLEYHGKEIEFRRAVTSHLLGKRRSHYCGDVFLFRQFASSNYILKASLACFFGNIGYGICIGSLGAAIPQMAKVIGCSEASLGVLFTMRYELMCSPFFVLIAWFRGIGYLIGTTVSVGLINSSYKVSKELMVCAASALMAVTMALLTWSSSLHALMTVMLFQGIGSGGTDVTLNCYIIELWGNRVQVWELLLKHLLDR